MQFAIPACRREPELASGVQPQRRMGVDDDRSPDGRYALLCPKQPACARRHRRRGGGHGDRHRANVLRRRAVCSRRDRSRSAFSTIDAMRSRSNTPWPAPSSCIRRCRAGPAGTIAIVTTAAYEGWARVAALFHPMPPPHPEFILPPWSTRTAQVDASTEIGPYVVIEAGGDRPWLSHWTVRVRSAGA